MSDSRKTQLLKPVGGFINVEFRPAAGKEHFSKIPNEGSKTNCV